MSCFVSRPIRGLRVIEFPYHRDSRQVVRRTSAWRELDDFRLCGVYCCSDVSVSLQEIRYPEDNYPADGSLNLLAYGDICRRIAEVTETAIISGEGVILVGGDCRQIPGLLGGISRALGENASVGLVWLDAHGDFNTPETSISGNYGGMPLAVCAGLCCEEWRSELGKPVACGNILLSDARSLDSAEQDNLIRRGVVHLDTESFCSDAWVEAVNTLAQRTDALLLHIDMDLLAAEYVPAHTMPEAHGPDIHIVMENIRTVMRTGRVLGFSVQSVFHDTGKREQDIDNLSAMRLLGAGIESWKQTPAV